MEINKIKKAAEIAKSRTSDKRWLAAIDKAVAGVVSGWWIITELASCLAITTETGNTYFANGVCQCEAYRRSEACKHRALYRLYAIANEIEETATEAVSPADEDETPSIATAKNPFDEDFYSDEFSEYGQNLFNNARPAAPAVSAEVVATKAATSDAPARYCGDRDLQHLAHCKPHVPAVSLEADELDEPGLRLELAAERLSADVAASTRQQLIAEIENIFPRVCDARWPSN